MTTTVVAERVETRKAAGDAKPGRLEHLRLLVDLLGYLTTNPDRPEGKKMVEILRHPQFSKYNHVFLRDLLTGLAEGHLIFIPPQRGTRDTIYITTREGRMVRDSLKASLFHK